MNETFIFCGMLAEDAAQSFPGNIGRPEVPMGFSRYIIFDAWKVRDIVSYSPVICIEQRTSEVGKQVRSRYKQRVNIIWYKALSKLFSACYVHHQDVLSSLKTAETERQVDKTITKASLETLDT